jgi:Ricin-type beta-trefoil lectin domain
MKRSTVVTVLAALVVLLLPSSAWAADPVLYHKVRNLAGENICLDADNSTLGQNGTKVQLWQCNGWDNQAWFLVPIPNKPRGWYTITNLGHNRKCLDADNGTIGGNGTRVQMWDCNGWENQQWLLFSNHTIQNAASRRCLDGDSSTLPANGPRCSCGTATTERTRPGSSSRARTGTR